MRSRLSYVMSTLGALAALFLLLPLAGLVLRTPWERGAAIAADPGLATALRLSLIASAVSLAISTVLGIPLAWLLARHEFPGKQALRALTTLPIVLPPVVGGVALLAAFGRRGILGGPLAEATGITFPFTFSAVVLAATFVSMPLLVITVEAAFRSMDRRLEDAAATLGGAPGYVFRRVALPLAARPIAAGMALCWTRALGEFGATITFAGNMPGRTQTVPLAVYLALETNPEVAYLGSLMLLAVSVAVLITLRGRGIATT